MDKSMHSVIKTTTRGLGLALALLATAGLARAAGFAIYENDARGFAMGNANVGSNDDASALYSNPAAITQLPGVQVKVGVTLIQPSIDVTTGNQFSGSQKFSMNNYTEVIPNLYATYRLTDNMSVGLGVFTPYGLKSDFQSAPQAWGGAFNNYYTGIKTTQITPTFAYRIVHDQPWAKSISVGVGVGFLYSNLDIRKQIDFTYSAAAKGIGANLAASGWKPEDIQTFLQSPAGQNQIMGVLGNKDSLDAIINGLRANGFSDPYAPLIMKGSGWDANYNLSLQYEINDQIAIGIVYRSVTRNSYHDASAEVVGISNGKASASITLPASWSFGVNYSPIVPLNIGINATYTQWSAWQSLDITTFGMNNNDPLGLNGLTTNQTKNWGNVWRYSIGGEYQANNQLAIRAGFVIDKDPVNQQYADFMVPSNDRQIYSVGLGWTISKYVTLDFAYGYLNIKGRNIAARPADGIYTNSSVSTGHANLFSVSGNFRF